MNKLINEGDKDLEKIISAKVLSDLVDKKSIVIGEALPDLGIVKDYYIDRKFNRQVRIKEKFLEEQDDKFVITGKLDDLINLNGKINNNDQVTWSIDIEGSSRKERFRFFLVTNDVADIDFKNLCKNYSEKNIHLLNLSNDNKFTWAKSHGSLKNLRKYLDDVKQDKDEIVNEDFLKERQDDIFVIIGEQENFTKLKLNEDKVTSSIDEDSFKQEKLRFFLLSSIPTDDDFKKLCDHYSKKGNIHLLSLSNDGKFTRKKFHRIGDTVAIISAEPGMGKSTVLTGLAQKIKKENSKLWVVRINLNDRTLSKVDNSKPVIESLLTIMKIDTPREIDDPLEKELFKHNFERGRVALLFDAFDEIGHDSEEKTIKLLQDIKNKKVERLLITTRTRKQIELEDKLSMFSYVLERLLPEEQEKFVKEFWEANLVYDMIKELITKIEKSSNPEEIKKLTGKISEVIELKIIEPKEDSNLKEIKKLTSQLDISKKELVEKVASLVGEQREASDKVKNIVNEIIEHDEIKSTIIKIENAEGYAKELIIRYPKSFSEKEKEFTEIPLQIRMLAEVFQGNFEKGIFEGEFVLPDKFNLFDLYGRFIESKYDIYFRKHLKEDLKKGSKLNDIRESVIRTLTKEHRSLALQMLFSKEENSLRGKDSRFGNIQDVGIIDKITDGSHEFIHRTFAEYFAASFFVDMLNKPKDHTKYQIIRDFLCEHIFKKENEVIRYFFDRMLADKSEIHVAVLNNDKEKIKGLLEKDRSIVNISDKAGRTPLHLAAAYGYEGIIELLLDKLKKTSKLEEGINAEDKLFDWSPLSYADRGSYWNVAELLLQKGANGDDMFEAIKRATNVDDEKETLLHIAAGRGYTEFARVLIEKGSADVNAENNEDITPLHEASRYGNLDIVKFFIEKEADVNAKAGGHRYDGYTPIHFAAQRGRRDNLEVIKFLVESKKAEFDTANKYGSTPLLLAAEDGNLDIVEYLMEKGANVNIKVNGRHSECEDGTILHLIASGRHGYHNYHAQELSEVLRKIIEKGVNINTADRNGNTPLHLIARGSHGYDKISQVLIVLEAFIQNGADVNITNGQGKTPVDLLVKVLLGNKANVDNLNAQKERSPEYTRLVNLLKLSKSDISNAALNAKIIKAIKNSNSEEETLRKIDDLIKKGANVNAKDDYSRTPLHEAAYSGKLNVVKYLIDQGANVNAEDDYNSTPLHRVAYSGRLDVVKYLINKGTDICAKDKDGRVPLHIAALSGKLDVVECLIGQGANVNAKDKSNLTPLHLAFYGGLDVVQYLIGQGADTNAADDNYGNTPLHRAAAKGELELVQLLLDNRANPGIKDKKGRTPLDLVQEQLARDTENEDLKTIIGLPLSVTDESKSQHQEEQASGSVQPEKCLPSTSSESIGRKKREAKECELSWEDVDEFNEEKKDVRDFSKIKIDSDRFINYIKSESILGDKLEQLVQLADKVQVTGKFQGLVNKLISNQKIMNHLNRVGRVSGIAMHGMMGKAAVADFLNGDYTGVAVNVGFIAGGQGFARVAQAASIKGAGLILDGKLLLGRSLKVASPFLARGTSAFVVYDLVSQIKEFKNGTEEALVSVIGDGIYLGVDAAEVGIEIAEAFEVFEGVSSITGPIGAAIGAVIFVGTDIYLAVKRVDKINEIIHLTGNERFFEGLRAFIGMQPEQYVEELMEEKQVNNQLVKQGLEYLQKHSDVQRYVFPTGKSVIDSCRDVPYKTSACVSGLTITHKYKWT